MMNKDQKKLFGKIIRADKVLDDYAQMGFNASHPLVVDVAHRRADFAYQWYRLWDGKGRGLWEWLRKCK